MDFNNTGFAAWSFGFVAIAHVAFALHLVRAGYGRSNTAPAAMALLGAVLCTSLWGWFAMAGVTVAQTFSGVVFVRIGRNAIRLLAGVSIFGSTATDDELARGCRTLRDHRYRARGMRACSPGHWGVRVHAALGRRAPDSDEFNGLGNLWPGAGGAGDPQCAR